MSAGRPLLWTFDLLLVLVVLVVWLVLWLLLGCAQSSSSIHKDYAWAMDACMGSCPDASTMDACMGSKPKMPAVPVLGVGPHHFRGQKRRCAVAPVQRVVPVHDEFAATKVRQRHVALAAHEDVFGLEVTWGGTCKWGYGSQYEQQKLMYDAVTLPGY